jgi:hypothetical protein
MATWPHISAKNKTDVLQEGLPTGSEGGLYIAGCTKHRWQSEPPSPGKNVMCTRWDTLEKSLSDAFPLRKAEGVGRAKIQGLVKAQNPL